MQLPICTAKPVALVGGGRLDEGDLANALRIADFLVAADGGAASALASGRVPDAVIGDLDSLKEADASLIPAQRIIRIAEQESTDFSKCIANVHAPLYVAVGFTGSRLDHELANFNVLARNSDKAILLVGESEICFAAGKRFAIGLPYGTLVSLFPFAEIYGSGSGLKWPFNGLKFSPTGKIGTSNEALGGLVELEFSDSGMLALLPKENLDRVAEALLARDGDPNR